MPPLLTEIQQNRLLGPMFAEKLKNILRRRVRKMATSGVFISRVRKKVSWVTQKVGL
jgi:hypothetical protein